MFINNLDKSLALSRTQNIYTKIQILNENLSPITEIEGFVTSGNLSINADSPMRRTCNMNIALPIDLEYIYTQESFWLNKYFRIYLGMENKMYKINKSEKIVWYNFGIFIIDNENISFDMSKYELSLSGIDYLAILNGQKYGVLKLPEYTFPKDMRIKDAVERVLSMSKKVRDYVVEDDGRTLPYEVKIEQARSIYEIIEELVNIYPGYEAFFDVDGVFHYQKIPIKGYNDYPLLDYPFMEQVVSSSSTTLNYNTIKNDIVIFGKTFNPRYSVYQKNHPDRVTFDKNLLSIKYDPEVSKIDKEDILCVQVNKYPENIDYSKPIQIVVGTTAPRFLYDEDDNIIFPDITDDRVITFQPSIITKIVDGKEQKEDSYVYLCSYQAYGRAVDENPESPFNIYQEAGVLTEVLSGGQYDNIQSDIQANERARYELYLRNRINDTITLTCIPLLFLNDVNDTFSYVRPKTSINREYIIKSLSFSFGNKAQLSITAARSYPEFYWM